MLDYTIGLISLAASNSLAVFCFCNVIIIAIIVVGSSSKTSPTPKLDQQDKFFPNGIPSVGNAEKCSKKLEAYLNEEANEGRELPSVSIDMIEEEEIIQPDEEQEIILQDDEDKDEDDDADADADAADDELRKRVEEFIEKINSGWRAEKIKTRLSLGQQLSLDQ